MEEAKGNTEDHRRSEYSKTSLSNFMKIHFAKLLFASNTVFDSFYSQTSASLKVNIGGHQVSLALSVMFLSNCEYFWHLNVCW